MIIWIVLLKFLFEGFFFGLGCSQVSTYCRTPCSDRAPSYDRRFTYKFDQKSIFYKFGKKWLQQGLLAVDSTCYKKYILGVWRYILEKWLSGAIFGFKLVLMQFCCISHTNFAIFKSWYFNQYVQYSSSRYTYQFLSLRGIIYI